VSMPLLVPLLEEAVTGKEKVKEKRARTWPYLRVVFA